MSSSILSYEAKKPILCKNPLRMYQHWILSSGNKMEELGYCGVCSNLAFTDNYQPTNPSPVRKGSSYPDSKINPKSGPCSKDTL